MKKFIFKVNEFEANSSFDRDSFGSLALNESFIHSKILMEDQVIDLIKLCKFISSDTWTLLYRGSRDGFGTKDFHLKCDNKSPTLTIIKAQESG